jgi:hypothetical protein
MTNKQGMLVQATRRFQIPAIRRSLGRLRLLQVLAAACALTAKTWAALAVTAADGAESVEAGRGAPRPSDELRLFRPHP